MSVRVRLSGGTRTAAAAGGGHEPLTASYVFHFQGSSSENSESSEILSLLFFSLARAHVPFLHFLVEAVKAVKIEEQ
jgi:hypothetical protein